DETLEGGLRAECVPTLERWRYMQAARMSIVAESQRDQPLVSAPGTHSARPTFNVSKRRVSTSVIP
ncbi:MAG: hypothetical protein ACREMQ_23095, partial [Longimicrobiales bacterium]